MPQAVELATHEWTDADAGSARGTVVLVHGVAGWHRTWWRVGPALAARGWRVVAVDLRGHGRSPRLDGAVTVADWAADLAALVQAAAPVPLVGHSLGGAVVADLAAGRPELVSRALLEDPPAISRVGDLAWLDNLRREAAVARSEFDREVARELAENPDWQPEDARQDVEGKTLADTENIVASFTAGVGTNVLPLAPRQTRPVLYLLGAVGRSVFPPEARQALLTTLPGPSEIRVIDAGHTIHRDRFEEYVRAVTDWIEREDG